MRFSALQRAENSSMVRSFYLMILKKSFSALQRAENSSIHAVHRTPLFLISFSALQRAENSSIYARGINNAKSEQFQCSSASRKFLNSCRVTLGIRRARRFSALQRAENSSMESARSRVVLYNKFQCSSASRKFLNRIRIVTLPSIKEVSVLFSEPKIPQSKNVAQEHLASECFSALQRAENSSIPTLAPASIHISDRDDHASSFLSLPGASP